jgi:hypothetical protein
MHTDNHPLGLRRCRNRPDRAAREGMIQNAIVPWYSAASVKLWSNSSVARLGQITGLVVLLVALLAVDIAVAQDTAWKDCERADRDPDRSIAACSKVLARSSRSARAGAFHNRGLAFAAKGNLDQAISDITAGSSTLGKANINRPLLTSLKRYG